MNIVDNLKIIRFENEEGEHGTMCKWALQVLGMKNGEYLKTQMFYVDGRTPEEVDYEVMRNFCKSMRTDGEWYEEKVLEQMKKRYLAK